MKIVYFSLVFLLLKIAAYADSTKPYVTAEIRCQLGNNLFIIATANALAWDNQCEVYFPDLIDRYEPRNPQNVKPNYYHVLFRNSVEPLPRPTSCTWWEPSFAYHPIVFRPDMKLEGYFQSEKYFAHHRQRILELFAPHPDDLDYMKKKYGWFIDQQNTVGIQLRKQWDDATGERYWQYGKDFLRKAMAYFPEDSLFIVSSDNVEFARSAIPEEMKNFYILEGEPHYIDFFLLTLCKHNIISNSTFGWWAAWLNQNPNKIVVTHRSWFAPEFKLPSQDLLPDEWIKIDAKSGPLIYPETYQ